MYCGYLSFIPAAITSSDSGRQVLWAILMLNLRLASTSSCFFFSSVSNVFTIDIRYDWFIDCNDSINLSVMWYFLNRDRIVFSWFLFQAYILERLCLFVLNRYVLSTHFMSCTSWASLKSLDTYWCLLYTIFQNLELQDKERIDVVFVCVLYFRMSTNGLRRVKFQNFFLPSLLIVSSSERSSKVTSDSFI